MNSKTSIFDFSNIFGRDITLRFNLTPVTINSKGEVKDTKGAGPYRPYLSADEELQEQYELLKTAIDAYHQMYIDKKLKHILCLPLTEKGKDGVEHDTAKSKFVKSCLAYIEDYGEKDKKKQTADLRTFISKVFADDNISSLPPYKVKSDFITKTLRQWLEQPDTKVEKKETILKIIEKNGSKLYANCQGLLEVRKRLYEKDGKSTSVPYRCIDRNLPRFSKDYHLFEKILGDCSDVFDFEQLDKDFSEELKGIARLSGIRVESVREVFQPLLYLAYLNQEGIQYLNTIIGTKKEKGTSALGLNEYINQYNQKQGIKKKKDGIPMLNKLNNQILFGDEVFIETLAEHKEAIPVIKKVVSSLGKLGVFDGECYENKLYQFLLSLSSYAGNIYVNTKVVAQISSSLWGDYSILYDAVKHDKNGRLIQKSVTLGELNEKIERLKLEDNRDAFEYFRRSQVKDVVHGSSNVGVFEQLKNCYNDFVEKKILKCSFFSEDQVLVIQRLFDSILSLQRIFKVFCPSLYEVDSDGLFVAKFSDYWNVLRGFDKDYDLLRNLFKRKPYSTDKIRVHFGLSNLMDGFVDSWTDKKDKGTQYNGYILRQAHSFVDENTSKELQEFQRYNYYLVISGNVRLFREKGNALVCEKKKEKLVASDEFSGFERFDYYQSSINNFNREFKRLTGRDRKSFTDEILQNEGKKELKSTYIENLIKVAKSMKRLTALQNLMSDEKVRKYSENLDYETLSAEIGQILATGRERKYVPVSTNEMKNLLKSSKNNKGEEVRTFMFRISNKDLSFAETMQKGERKSHGAENLHTMYFRALLDTLQNTFDIGTGTVFFRGASDKRKMKYDEQNPTHRKGEELAFKNPYNKDKKKSVFGYDLIKDRRYTKDSYLFHLSITQNYQKKGSTEDLNAMVRDYICTQKDLRIIGIDRGERNLLYATMIDGDGRIIEQKSFNVIGYMGKTAKGESFQVETDYHQLLNEKAGIMRSQQKEWKEMDGIQDIKDGYLSVVVHELAKMIVANNAIIVMEDLNQGFMGSRQSQLANVYQKFEEKLRNKLQFYVDKHKRNDEPSGLYHALQLAGQETRDNQNGFIFYIPAWNTSKIDPVTGFVNLFNLKYTNIKDARALFSTFDKIEKNPETGHYDFVFNYSSMARKKMAKKMDGTRSDWTLSTHGGRIVKEQKGNYWEYRKIESLTSEFDALFEEYGIEAGANLQEAIVKCDKAEFFKMLIRLMKWTLQLRNYDDKGNDYLISPVCYRGNEYFCSLDYDNEEGMCISKSPYQMPKDADANGAFNIARKGLMLCERLKEGGKTGVIKGTEWLQYVQKMSERYVGEGHK